MTRWGIVADLNRCVGCQTCTAACKHANATAPGVQWRKVLDIEAGEFPDVRRSFVPVGCMHCDDAPCMDVCPTTATRKREDGLVTIDYDKCIGCGYCIVACPYGARSKVTEPARAFGGKQMRHEALREDPARLNVAQKCTFCIDRIDGGLARGEVPGLDSEATPACVNSCIASALHFGDLNDPDSNVSHLLAENESFTMHPELGTGPGIHYLYDRDDNAGSAGDAPIDGPPEMVAEPVGMGGVVPKLQNVWDWRAATNFILGGTGSGLAVAGAVAGALPLVFAAALMHIALGLFAVWLEIGRPWRFLNVFRHPQRSWMTREALAAMPLFACGGLTVLTGHPAAVALTGVFGMIFLYSQARILNAAKGIPAWRQKGAIGLIAATGLTEGTAALTALAGLAMMGGLADVTQVPLSGLCGGLAVLVAVRHAAWRSYRRGLGETGAPVETFKALDGAALRLTAGHQMVVVALLLGALILPGATGAALAVAGAAVALASGWAFKGVLITRAAFDQGYALERFPARGAGKPARGVKPGWSLS